MDFAEFQSTLKKAKSLPVYAVHGDEAFLAEQAVQLIREKALEGEDPSACCVEYDAAQGLTPAAVFDELRMLPFFGKKRVATVRNADAFIRDHGESLARYLQSPSRTGVLILVAENIDARTSLAKAIDKAGAVIACKTMRTNEVKGWIVQKARELGNQITPRACMVLVENAGADLFQLAMHIEKLSVFVSDRKTIEEKDVEALVGPDRERASYELGSAVRKKQADAALKILRDILSSDREAAYWLVGSLAREIRTIWSVRRLLATGGSDADIIAAAPFARSWLAAYKSEVRPYTPDEVKRKYRLLLDTDLRNKTSGMDMVLSLECLIVELCR